MAFPLGAVVAGAGALLGGISSSRAASRAADAQEKAAREAIDLQREMYGDAVDRFQPYYDVGTNALGALGYQFGVGPRPGSDASLPQITTRTIPGASVGVSPRNIGEIADLQQRRAMSQQGGDNEYLFTNGDRRRLKSLLEANQPQGGTPDREVYMVGDMEFGNRGEAEAYRESLRAAQGDFERIDRPLWDTGTRADIGRAMISDGQAGVSVNDGNVFFDPGAGFETSPGFEFMRDESEQALSRMAAARGLRLSGNTLEEAQRNAMGLAQQDYWNYFGNNAGVLEGNFLRNLNDEIRGFNSETAGYNSNIANLFQLAGMGQAAAAQQGAGQMQLANNTTNLLGQAGQAQAMGAIGQNNALQGTLGNFAQIYGMNQAGYFDQPQGRMSAYGSGNMLSGASA
jgi:hypothetical protein